MSFKRGKTPSGLRHFKLYQILVPRMAYRGRVFGTHLALKDDWEAVDESFFAAPGQSRSPLWWPLVPHHSNGGSLPHTRPFLAGVTPPCHSSMFYPLSIEVTI